MKNTSYYGEDLIFIISQPRSGSTLLQRILSGHPDIQTSAETWLMLHPLYAHKTQDINSIYNTEWASIGVKEFMDNYTDGQEVYDEALRLWAHTIYGNALNKGNKKFFLDKTPRYFLIIPDLYRLFPKAKFIFLLRNPMAVLASEINTYINGNWPFLSELAPDLVDAPKLILEGIQLLGSNAIVIHYEKFASDPETNIGELCKQLNLEFHSSMLDYSKTEAPKGRLNDPTGIHQHTKTSNTSIDKWKKMANDSQEQHLAISYLKNLGTHTIEKYGYSFDDIEKELSKTNSNTSNSKPIFPWDVAITSKEKWGFREKYIADAYFASLDKGNFMGKLIALTKVFGRLLKKFK